MERSKKNWEKPVMLTLDGTKVEGGVIPIPEGFHVTGTATGSSFIPS